MTNQSNHLSHEDESEEGSTIHFPVNLNVTEDEVLLHYGVGDTPLPVYSVDKPPLDPTSTLTNTLHCPVKYISKAPPTLVSDNFCFIVDGDKVSPDEILEDKGWWKQTSTTTRFYQSDTLRTFHQVTMLTCRGQIRCAYRSLSKGGGVSAVPLEEVYRVARHFSYWRTCKAFHRIVSVISPITSEGIRQCGFRQRLFVQYFWRSQRSSDKDRVQREYAECRSRLSVQLPSSLISKSWAPSFDTIPCEENASSSTQGSLSSPLRNNNPRLSMLTKKREKRAMSLTPSSNSTSIPRLSLDGIIPRRHL